MGPLKRYGTRVALLAVATLLLVGATQASAEVTLKGTLPAQLQFPYTLAPDDTFWETTGNSSGSGGTVTHVDEDGNNLGDGFQVTGGYVPLAIGYYGGRVYVVNGGSGNHSIYSFRPAAGGIYPDPLYSDFETGLRLGSTQAIIRVVGGGAYLALGQNNTVVTVNFTPPQAAPFYPQFVMGWGINTNSDGGFQTCEVDAPATPGHPPCAQFSGRSGPELGHFNYPIDVAPGPNGSFYVLEYYKSRITVMAPAPEGSGLSGPLPVQAFPTGAAGSGAGQLNQPFSLVRGGPFRQSLRERQQPPDLGVQPERWFRPGVRMGGARRRQ